VVVCFVAGVLLANFPGPYKQRLLQMLTSLERPIYLVFLMVVGAIWRAADALGWILMVVFVLARLGGKWVGTNVPWGGVIDLDPRARKSLVFAPMGALAVAIVVNAGMLYPGRSISAIVTAVLGGAIVGELLIQRALRAETPLADATPVPATRSKEGGEPTTEQDGGRS
jgi:hypothetical protein